MKITITDKMMYDILDCFLGEREKAVLNLTKIKNTLKQKGYEVEEKKSKLDEARDFIIDEWTHEDFQEKYSRATDYDSIVICIKGTVDHKITLYEQAIREIQEQNKIDDNLIDWLRSFDKFACENETINENDVFLANKLLQQLGVNSEERM